MAPSQLPRYKLQRSTGRQADDSLSGLLLDAVDVSLLNAAPLPSWLVEDSFVGVDATLVRQSSPVPSSARSSPTPNEPEVDLADDLTPKCLLPFADPEDEASDDEVLASYREEPACEVTTVLDSLRRSGSSLRSSVLGVAPVDYVTSTPRPSHQAFAAPAPMTVNRDLDLACSAADYRSRLSASTSSAANQTSISSSSANLSASFVRPPDPLDDMFERRKRDLNRNSGIHVDEELLDIPFLPPPGYIFLSIDERPMVRLPVRASGGLGEGPTSRQERDEMPPPPPRPRASNVVPLSSSVIGLTLPREFNFAKPAPPPGMSARERSAARAEESARQRSAPTVSAAFAAPKTKSRPRPSSAAPLKASTKRGHGDVEAAPRLPLADRSNTTPALMRPAVARKAGRASFLAQSQPAPPRKMTEVVPFTFRSSIRSDRPTPLLATSTAGSVRAHDDEQRKRKRDERKERPAATEARPFAFHTDKRRREAI